LRDNNEIGAHPRSPCRKIQLPLKRLFSEAKEENPNLVWWSNNLPLKMMPVLNF
jgi:hypothetical protein